MPTKTHLSGEIRADEVPEASNFLSAKPPSAPGKQDQKVSEVEAVEDLTPTYQTRFAKELNMRERTANW